MATITSNGTGGGLWGTGASWNGGVVPADNDDVVIAAGDVVTLDIDTSGYANGLVSVLVQSHVSTPGTLRWMNGHNGILKIKSGAVATNRIQGDSTSAVCLGRVLANYSGLWTVSTATATFLASQSGITGIITDGGDGKRIFTPAVAPAWVVDALIGESININGTVYAIEGNDATTVMLTTGPGIGATVTSWVLVVRPLPAANTCKIMLGALSAMVTQYLDVALYSNEPMTKNVRTYGTTSTFTAATTDLLTLNVNTSIILTANTPVYLSTSGTLPAGLSAGMLYYVRAISGAACKLSTTPDDSGIVDITGTGTGIHCITHGILNVTSIAANLITMATALPATPWANSRWVMFTSSGTYPTGIEPDTLYRIRNLTAAAGTFNIGLTWLGPILTLGTTWTGTLRAYIGSAATVCTSIAVLDDVTGESTTWVPTSGSTFATTLGLSAVILADEGPTTYDTQRFGLLAATPTTMTLSAAIDSDQYPNSRVWLVSRNVGIQSACVTGVNVIDATNTTGGIFGEIRATQGTGTTFYGRGISQGAYCSATVISGFSTGINFGNFHTAGIICGCFLGISGSDSCAAISISGCDHGISGWGSFNTATTISGCTRGISSGEPNTATTIRMCSTGLYDSTSCTALTINCCQSGIYYGTSCSALNIVGCTGSAIQYGNMHAAITIRGCGTGINESIASTATTISGCQVGISDGSSCAVETISDCTTGMSTGRCNAVHTISGCTIGVHGFTNLSAGASNTVNTVSNCDTGLESANVILVGGGVLSSITQDIRRPCGIIGYGVSLQCATPVAEYLHATQKLVSNVCGVTIYDLKSNTGTAQPGYVGRWDVGGKTISTAFNAGTHDATAQIEALYGSAAPPCCIHATVTENVAATPATVQHVLDMPLWSAKGQNLKVNIYAKQVTTGFDARAKFSIIDLGSGGTLTGEVLDSWSIADNTNWQTIELVSGIRSQEGPLVLRLEVRGQSKELYWFQVIPEPVGRGGFTFGDESRTKVLTTATGAGTYQPVAATDVRLNVNVGIAPAKGELINVLTVGGNQMRRI